MGRGSDGPGKEAHGETGRGTGRLARAANRDAAIQPRCRRGLFVPWHVRSGLGHVSSGLGHVSSGLGHVSSGLGHVSSGARGDG